MINTVAKIELGLAAVALILGIGVGNLESDPGGLVLLFGIAVAVTLAGLAFTGSGFKDFAPEYASPQDAPPLQMVSLGRTQAPKPSPWPFVGAASAGLIAVGLAVGHGLIYIGIVVAVVVAAGWMTQDWREDPSFTASEGARISSRILAPVGLPLMALGLIAVIVISISRVLLTLPRIGSIVTAFAIAILLLLVFFGLSARPHLTRKTLVLLGGFAVVAVATAGSVGAANGYRTFDRLKDTGAASLTIVAHNTAFNTKTITVTAGQLTTITFKNLDPIYHNVAVYGPTGKPYWDGEPIKGVEKITYTHTFDLPPGKYVFRCDFHPTVMIGTIIVKPAGATS